MGRAGLEPATGCFEGICSDPLSYRPGLSNDGVQASAYARAEPERTGRDRSRAAAACRFVVRALPPVARRQFIWRSPAPNSWSSLRERRKRKRPGGKPPGAFAVAREVGLHRPPSKTMSGRIRARDFAPRHRADERMQAARRGAVRTICVVEVDPFHDTSLEEVHARRRREGAHPTLLARAAQEKFFGEARINAPRRWPAVLPARPSPRPRRVRSSRPAPRRRSPSATATRRARRAARPRRPARRRHRT